MKQLSLVARSNAASKISALQITCSRAGCVGKFLSEAAGTGRNGPLQLGGNGKSRHFRLFSTALACCGCELLPCTACCCGAFEDASRGCEGRSRVGRIQHEHGARCAVRGLALQMLQLLAQASQASQNMRKHVARKKMWPSSLETEQGPSEASPHYSLRSTSHSSMNH